MKTHSYSDLASEPTQSRESGTGQGPTSSALSYKARLIIGAIIGLLLRWLQRPRGRMSSVNKVPTRYRRGTNKEPSRITLTAMVSGRTARRGMAQAVAATTNLNRGGLHHG